MTLFLKLFNMSVAAGWLVLAILVLRLLFKKAPKALLCVLWALVGVRLVCPFSFESVLSLIPSAETLPQSALLEHHPTIQSGIAAIDYAINPVFSESFAATPMYSANPLQIYTFIASVVWVAGMVLMLIYTVISFWLLHRKTRESIETEKGIFVCDRIDTPFILGLFRPKIFLPSGMDERDREYVLAHERAHLARRDHLWKPLGFSLLAVYWFNPILWVAYIMLCRDIELACDERVIRQLGEEIKRPYSDALINCSVPRRTVSACPLAFGETGIKRRIKSVLNYKKPTAWLIAFAVVISTVAAVCFLTNPKTENFSYTPIDGYTTHEDVSVSIDAITVDSDNPQLSMSFVNKSGKEISYGEQFKLYRKTLGLKINCKKNWQEFWNEPLWVFSGETATRDFYLSDYDLSHAGEYQLEFKFTVDGEGEHNAVLTFRVEKKHTNGEISLDGDTYDNVFNATVLEITDSSQLLVKPFEDESESKSSDKILVPTKDLYLPTSLGVGDSVQITYDGTIMESYPAQLGTVFSVIKLEDTLTAQSALLEDLISSVIMQKNNSDKSPHDLVRFESHKILSSDYEELSENKGIITHYLYVQYLEYTLNDGTLIPYGGYCGPVAIEFDIKLDEMHLKSYWTPRDGSLYESSIREKFPADAANYILANEADIIKLLQAKNDEKAKKRIAELTADSSSSAPPDAGGTDPYALFDIKVAYAGWTDIDRLYSGGLNPDGMAHAYTRRPPVYRFETREEFTAFYENFKDSLAFSQRYDSVPSVDTVMQEYGDSVFSDRSLFAVYVTAASGSIRYRLKGITNDGESLSFEITQSNHPQIFTDDMAGWLIFIPMPKSAVATCIYFDAYIS